MKIIRLTKLQRHTAYIILLEEAKGKLAGFDTSMGLCRLIADTLCVDDNGNYTEDAFNRSYFDVIDNFFPELLAKEPFPHEDPVYWFLINREGWQKRIELLKQCIEETI
jgi:predicted HNH restriction endonuclease